MSKNNEVMNVATENQLAILDESYPVEDNIRGPRIPRLGFLSKDVVEESGTGKNKKIKVVQSGGTFFKEIETDEINEETGKKVWTKEYIGDMEPIEGVIFFHRRQLRMYDAVDEMFISSPIYDSNEEVIPLYKGASQIDKGTPKELQAKYPALTQKGKPSSKLKEEKILYILVGKEVFQINLSQSSKFAFSDYSRKTRVNRVTTIMSASEEMTNGTNTYRHILFTEGKPITKEQADLIIPAITEINEYVKAKQERFGTEPSEKKSEEDFKNL